MSTNPPTKLYLAITPFFRNPGQTGSGGSNFETGFYRESALGKAMKCIRPAGPPLPLVIGCTEDDADALAPIIEIAEDLHKRHGGGSNESAPKFVNDFVKRVEGMVIWPQVPIFYGILASPGYRKLITVDKKLVTEAQAGNNTHTIFEFDSFVKAFVYILGGGNLRLRDMGLHSWVGKRTVVHGGVVDAPLPDPSFSRLLNHRTQASASSGPAPPEPSPRPRSSVPRSPAPRSPTQATVKGTRGPQALGKAKSQPMSSDDSDDVEFVGFIHKDAGSQGNPPPCLNRPRRPDQGGSVDHPGLGTMHSLGDALPTPSASRMRQSNSPNAATARQSKPPSDVIIPTHFLQDYRFSSAKVPFGVLRSGLQDNEVVYLGDHRVKNLNRLPPASTTFTLPPLVNVYLTAHGWDSVVIELVSQLHSEGASLADFLVDLGLAQVPILEAYFVWVLKENN